MSGEASDPAGPAVEAAVEAAAALSPWAALGLAAAKALKAFIDTLADARRSEAKSVLGQAQVIADRIAARADKAAGVGTTGPAQ